MLRITIHIAGSGAWRRGDGAVVMCGSSLGSASLAGGTLGAEASPFQIEQHVPRVRRLRPLPGWVWPEQILLTFGKMWSVHDEAVCGSDRS